MIGIALLPLLVITLNSTFVWAQRTLTQKLQFGQTTEIEARLMAIQTCQTTFHFPVLSTTATRHTAYVRRGEEAVHEWSIICQTENGKYEVGIEADAGRVFSVTSLGKYEKDSFAEVKTVAGSLSPSKMEAQARRFARVVGVSPRSLRLSHSTHTGDIWDFTYLRHVPGNGVHSLKVTLGQDGGLETVWNPMRTL